MPGRQRLSFLILVGSFLILVGLVLLGLGS